jgi:hypothetical protein
MPRPSRELERQVIQRADGRCEYCQLLERVSDLPFHVDHIIAEKHRGQTVLENLAWACFSCNMHKGPNVAGVDPVTDEVVRLFHPRQDAWSDHFRWQGSWLHGLTEIGRTTIAVLEINDADAVLLRELLSEAQ